MIICICHRVSDRDIARTAQDGCASFDELQFELLVGTSCGKCHDCARETFQRHAAQATVAGPYSARSASAGCAGLNRCPSHATRPPSEALNAPGA